MWYTAELTSVSGFQNTCWWTPFLLQQTNHVHGFAHCSFVYSHCPIILIVPGEDVVCGEEEPVDE
jgi:hypothetical protein